MEIEIKPAGADTPDLLDIVAERTAALLGLPVTFFDTGLVMLLTVAADVCLYNAPGGSGAAVLLVLGAAGCLACVWAERQNANKLLIATLLLTAAASAWNHYWLLSFVGWGALLAYAIKLRRPDWGIAETMWAMPKTIMLAPLRFIGHCRHAIGRVPGQDPATLRAWHRIPLRVVVAPLIVLILFVIIFIAANPVVERMASNVWERVGEWAEWLGKFLSLFRTFTWVCWLLAFAALVRPAITSFMGDRTMKWREDLDASCDGPAAQKNFATAVSTLLSVNVLFLAFNAIDSVYLYFKVSLPENISYSEYTHRGCFWLTMALALSTIVIGAIFKGRLNFHPKRKLIYILSYIWAGQNAVLAIGALRRLQLYVDYNGLTRLRIVGIYGVLLVIAGLALMVWKVRYTRTFAWLVRRDMIALWVAIIVLALTPRDWICAKYNAEQAMTGNLRGLTLLHGQPLSPESFPPLIPLLDYEGDQGKPDEEAAKLVREGVAGLLGRELLVLRESKPTRWTAWQGSHAWALRRLEAVSDRLDTTPRKKRGAAEDSLREYTRQWW